jgi:aspartate aminotransferase
MMFALVRTNLAATAALALLSALSGNGNPSRAAIITAAFAIVPESATATTTSSPAPETTAKSSSFSPSSYLGNIPMGKPDPILGINESYKSCTDPRKVNVCVGAYRDSSGMPWILPSVKLAERRLLDDPSSNKEYAPIAGDGKYVDLALKFAYGSDDGIVDLSNIAGMQTLSGTGACRVGGHFLSKFVPKPPGLSRVPIYIPSPTWGNHISIFEETNMDVRRYRYYDYGTNRLDYHGLIEDLSNAPDGSVILLHACAHNPTGCDPTMEQWHDISELLLSKGHVVFFDSAYQGFASGDAEMDARALRYFVSRGHKVMLAQSFAKNFGLYGERTGTISVVCSNPNEKMAVLSQLKLIARPMYSSPPIHGSNIVRTVLTDPELTSMYYDNCGEMASRIRSMREKLVNALKEVGSLHDWGHVTEQIGMFAFTGMSADMCDILTAEYSIFLTRDGRISLAGLNDGNIEYVARAIHAVTDGKAITS